MDAVAYLIGSGSMSLGVEAAGFTIRQVWETPGYAKNAKTWQMNRPEPVQVRDLHHLDPVFQSLRGSVDLFYGNPPCGGLSSMTSSRIESPTNNCMRHWIRMVVQAQPRMILMENAYQLATDRCWPLLGDLTGVLDLWGYTWWTWLFYSYQVGTPQIRRRMFLCATLDKVVRPELGHLRDIERVSERSQPIWPWIADLEDVPPQQGEVVTAYGIKLKQHGYDDMEKIGRKNELLYEHWHRLKARYLTDNDWKNMSARVAAGCQKTRKEMERKAHRYWPDCPREFKQMHMYRPQFLEADKPAPAIIGNYKFVHPTRARFLTMREMARIMGYPDHWNFHVLEPHLIAQGIPVNNAYWAAARMRAMIGKED